MSTLQYNVMVPHISPSWLRHGTRYITLVWISLAYTPCPTPT